MWIHDHRPSLRKLDVFLGKMQANALTATYKDTHNRIILAKPQTYMNLSGQAVSGLLHFYKIPTEQLLVIHDDLDLPFGSLRIRPAGGSGGQKGLGSTIDRLGTQDFARLRMGIGRPPGRMEASDYVLQPFSSSDNQMLDSVLDAAAEAALLFVHEGLDTAMNRYNGSERKNNMLDLIHSLPGYSDILSSVGAGKIIPGLGLIRSARLPVAVSLGERTDAPIQILTDRSERAFTMGDELKFWFPTAHRMAYPAPNPLFYEQASWGNITRRERLQTLAALAAYHIPGAEKPANPPLIFSPIRAIMARTLPRRDFLKVVRTIKVGSQHSIEFIASMG